MKTLNYKRYIPVLFMTGLLFTSCEDLSNHTVDGNGNRTTDTRSLQAFRLVQLNGDFEVQIDTGSVFSALVEADENLIDLIVTYVSGNKLIIESANGTSLKPTHPIQITITTTALDEITLNGSGYVYCYGLETGELTMNLAGSGQIECYDVKSSTVNAQLEGSGLINCRLVSENLTASIEGSGEIKLSGESLNTDYKIIGSGQIKANYLNTGVSVVYISGSGVADTRVSNALDVTIMGSGIVYYTGNPSVESSISGSGKVIKR
jgi:hypothetical protein